MQKKSRSKLPQLSGYRMSLKIGFMLFKRELRSERQGDQEFRVLSFRVWAVQACSC